MRNKYEGMSQDTMRPAFSGDVSGAAVRHRCVGHLRVSGTVDWVAL